MNLPEMPPTKCDECKGPLFPSHLFYEHPWPEHIAYTCRKCGAYQWWTTPERPPINEVR